MAGMFDRFIKLFLIATLLGYGTGAFGYTCAQIFPDGVSNHLDAGIIKIASNSRIRLSPDGVVATKGLADNSGGTSCDTRPCTATAVLPPAQSYSNFPGGAPVKLGYQQALTLAPGHYGGLSTGGESILTLTSGEYSFAGSFVIGSAAQIKVPSGAKVAVYASDYINFQGAALINSPSSDSTLLLYTNNYMNIASGAKVNALLYMSSYLSIANPGEISGAISAGGTVNLNSVTYVTYEATRVASASFPSFCSASGPASLAVQPATTAASTCAPVSVTVSALKADGSLMSDYKGTFTLSTSTGRGDWSKTGVAADAYGTLTPGGANSGSASYAFAADGSDGGNAVLRLANSHAEALTITASDLTAGISASAKVSFSANAFVVDSTDALGTDVVAGRPHAWRIRMMRQDAATGVCSVASGYAATQVSAWFTRSAQDPGGAVPQLKSASATISLPETAPATANFALPFSAGVATFDLLTSDVGQYSLAFADTSLTFSDKAISGSSETVTTRPFGLHLNISGNPAAADALGTAFQAAGRDFTANVKAVVWQLADDADGNGLPDGHADADPTNNASLADNASLLRFGKEALGESVTLTAYLVSPTGGVNPGLGSSLAAPADGRVVTAFTGGAGSTGSVFFNEVGVAELVASITDGQYLSSTKTVGGRSGRVGRFTPATFSLSAGSLTPACTQALDFSYMGQSFGANYTATALSARGTKTANYEGSYAKLSNTLGQVTFGAINAAVPASMNTRLSASNHRFTWLQGAGSVQTDLVLQRAAAPDGPFGQLGIGVSLQDADGIGFKLAALNLDSDINGSNDKISLGQTEVRFGRLRLDPSFGPETANLPVVLLTEYWDGVTWRTNQDDSCTLLALSAVTYPSGTINITANRSISVGGGASTGTYSYMSSTDIGFANGNARHYFTAPGAGNTGTFAVNTDLSAYPWLWFDWNGDGSYSDSALPPANYTFGAYRGHDRVLYWQEILN